MMYYLLDSLDSYLHRWHLANLYPFKWICDAYDRSIIKRFYEE